MTMIDESCMKVSVRAGPIADNSGVRKLPPLEAEWFERPVQVGSGALPTFSGQFFAHTPQPTSFPQLWQDKMKAYLGIRFTAVYTVVFSVTPFHSGLIRASWEPITARGAFTWDRSSTVTSFTLPGDCMNVQEFTSVCVACPWSNNVPYQGTAGVTDQASGTMRLHQIVPVVSPSGSEAPTYTVFLHLEDLEFVGPTSNVWSNVQPQSGVIDVMKSTYDMGRKRTQQFIRASTVSAKVKAASGIVEDLRSTRAISTVLGAGSTVASALGAIPLLSAVAAPTGWMLRVMSNTAARWGFSKPEVNAPLTRVYHMPTAYDNNATGEDPAPNLSLFHDLAIPPANVTGCALDEQAFPYVCSVPGLISRFDITNQTSSTLVYSIMVSPSSAYWQANSRAVVPLRERLAVLGAAPFPAFDMSPTAVVGSLAAYWSGDMVYTFRFIKTRFHTGRLVLAWYAGDEEYGAGANINRGLTGYSYPPYTSSFSADRVTIDLKECNEYTFRVPFTHLQGALNQQGFSGVLCMYVIDPVKAPATVSPGVTVVVSASMAEPKFSGVTGLPFAPTSNRINNLFTPQSGVINLHANTGEPLETFNTIGKRLFYRTVLRQPFAQTLPTYTPNPTAPTAASAANVDLIDLIRSGYVYERGGMIVATRPNTGLDTMTMTLPGTAGGHIARMTFAGADLPTVSQTDTSNIGVRAYVPRYSVFPVAKCDAGGISDVAGALREPSRIPPAISATDDQYARAVADDHVFSYFVGFPPMVRASLS